MNENTSPGRRETGLQTTAPSGELAQLRQRMDELSDAMDLLPLVEGFREQLDEERQEHRRRTVGLSVFFLILMGMVISIPILMGKRFADTSTANAKAQIEAQEQLVNKLSQSLDAVAAMATGMQAQPAPTTIIPPGKIVTPPPLRRVPTPRPQTPPEASVGTLPATPAPGSSAEDRGKIRGDLESLLSSIEQAIADKENALQAYRDGAQNPTP